MRTRGFASQKNRVSVRTMLQIVTFAYLKLTVTHPPSHESGGAQAAAQAMHRIPSQPCRRGQESPRRSLRGAPPPVVVDLARFLSAPPPTGDGATKFASRLRVALLRRSFPRVPAVHCKFLLQITPLALSLGLSLRRRAPSAHSPDAPRNDGVLAMPRTASSMILHVGSKPNLALGPGQTVQFTQY
jgi:hypothetical protein